MACKPGEITQLTCTGEQICASVEQTASQAGQLTDHENRITVNTNQIIENTNNISNLDNSLLEVRVSNNEENIRTTQNFTLANKDLINENLTKINNLRIDVDNHTTTLSALPTTYAQKGGSTVQTFEVANPSSGAHAMNQSWGDARYEFVGVAYTKAESDNQYLAKLGTAVDSARLGSELATNYVLKTLIATDSTHGIARQATDAEAAAGTATDCYMTPKQVADAIAAIP